jgi:hypothetical protein
MVKYLWWRLLLLIVLVLVSKGCARIPMPDFSQMGQADTVEPAK